MSEILGLSFDRASYPLISIKTSDALTKQRFGLSWYPNDDLHATILKNVKADQEEALINALRNKEDFSSSIFLCLLTEGNSATKLKNAQPFTISFARRDWTMIQSANIENSLNSSFLSEKSFFKPKGDTTEEILFCWLLESIREKNHFSLSDVGWSNLYELFTRLNTFSKANILISDGNDLVAYHNINNTEPFYVIRYSPPHPENAAFSLDKINLALDGGDFNHTFILFSNMQLENNQAMMLTNGQMLVARRGEIIWDSNNIPLSTAVNETASIIDMNPTLRRIFFLEANKETNTTPIYISSTSNDAEPITYSILHESKYHYQSSVFLSKHLLRLQPLHDLAQSLLKYRLSLYIDDRAIDAHACNFSGAFGNNATSCEILEPYKELRIVSESIVTLTAQPLMCLDLLHQQRAIPLIWMPWDRIMMQAYLIPPELPESELFELSDYAMSFVKRNENDVLAVLNDINQTISRDYSYVTGSTNLSTSAYDVYVHRRGVCQDFANLFICLARLLNIPARYRVGYVYTGNQYQNTIQSDASHAWVEVFLPSVGWMGFDPTNNCMPIKNHIRVACGRNYHDATPTSGVIYKGGGHESLETSVKVIAIENKDLNLEMLLN